MIGALSPAMFIAAVFVALTVKNLGEGVILAASVLAALIYIAGKVRKGVSKLDKLDDLMSTVPDRLTALENDSKEQREEHQNAHTEMLSAVQALDGRLDVLERRSKADHEHVQAITRELDVPVRRHPRDAA